MEAQETFVAEGGSDCREIRYRLERQPQFVRCCHYVGTGEPLAFVRVATRDWPALRPLDLHVFTSIEQSWLILPPGTLAVAEHY